MAGTLELDVDSALEYLTSGLCPVSLKLEASAYLAWCIANDVDVERIAMDLLPLATREALRSATG